MLPLLLAAHPPDHRPLDLKRMFIGDEPPAPGYPFRTPTQIAEQYWQQHVRRDGAELVIG